MCFVVFDVFLHGNVLRRNINPMQIEMLEGIETQVSEVNEVNEVKEVKGRCHWDVVYFSALNRTAKLLSFNFPWCEHSELTPLTSLTSIKSITSET